MSLDIHHRDTETRSNAEGKYKAYPEYKDSGVEWLGKIPEGWFTSKHKYIADFQKGKNPEVLFDKQLDGLVKYLSMDYLRGSSDPSYARVETNSCLSIEGQPLIIWDGSNAGEFVKGEEGIVSSTMAASKIQATINKDYYWYLCVCLEPEMRRHANGMGIPHVDGDELKGSVFPIPSIEEQKQIAKFLDHETAKMDTLIEKQQQLIKLLKEKRQAVISHAVTKGLNPNAPMKDSGVEWLGDVPSHWDVATISSLSNKITNGYVGPTRDIFYDSGVRYLQSLHIKGNKIDFHTPYFVSKEWSDGKGKSILKEGDVLVVQTGDIGQVAAVTKDYEGCNCHALIIIATTSELDGFYLSWLLNSDYGFHSLKSIQTGALHPHLNCNYVKTLKVTVPPIKEQREVIKYLTYKTEKIDKLISKTKQAIELIKERRTALISAAVTGKIDVRGLV